MRYLDVCAGISAPTVAWMPLGWQAVAYAEIEPAPRAILAHHYPDVPLVGDFTEIRGSEFGPVDLLVGGTPCQDFSIAGLRAGLDGDRGNLSLEFLRLADRTRPRWLAWENVPGVLSIDAGRAFGAILGGMAELGYGFAYRILDAQHFGVPQRRRRVFVVGYLGDWRRAAAVLFERHSLSGHPAPRREVGQRTAGTLEARLGRNCGMPGGNSEGDLDNLIAATLDANFGRLQGCSGQDLNHGHSHLIAFGGNNTTGPIDVSTALSSAVRRLTPRECERLQGFPDDYTFVPYRKGMMADGPRYKALGNSMAVPVMRWIGERIQAVETLQQRQAA